MLLMPQQKKSFSSITDFCFSVPAESFPPAPLRYPDDEQSQKRASLPAGDQPGRPLHPLQGHSICMVSSCFSTKCLMIRFVEKKSRIKQKD